MGWIRESILWFGVFSFIGVDGCCFFFDVDVVNSLARVCGWGIGGFVIVFVGVLLR